MKESNVVNITYDWEVWKNYILKHETENVSPDVIIFIDDISEYITGYMLKGVANVNSQLLIECTLMTNSLDEVYDALKSYSTDFDVYLHYIQHRFIVVDDYKINNYIIKFATCTKQGDTCA